MSWTETPRPKYCRDHLRSASDMTDEEGAPSAPYMPPLRPLGPPRTTNLRSVVDALFHLSATGCPWRVVSHGFFTLFDGAEHPTV